MLATSIAPAFAACNPTSSNFVCYEAGSFSGNATLGQVFFPFTNKGSIDTLAAFNYTGPAYGVLNYGTLGTFTFSAISGGTRLDGYSFKNYGTITTKAQIEAGAFSFENHKTINGQLVSLYGDTAILNFSGATIAGLIDTRDGDDLIFNAGTITGSISLGNGNNGLANSGLITADLLAGTGDDTVVNFTHLSGNVDLGAGANSFDNYPNAVLETKSTFNVGAGNSIDNYGIISPGGAANVQTTNVTGDYIQFQSGAYLTTLASAASADQLAISGDAELAGSIIINRTGAIGNTGSAVILTAADIDNNLNALSSNGWRYALSVVAGSGGGGITYYRYDYTNCCGNYVVATSSMVGDGVSYSTHLYEPDGFGGYTMSSLTQLPTADDQLVLSWDRMGLLHFIQSSSVPLTDQQHNVAVILQSAEATSPAVRALNDALLDNAPEFSQWLVGTVLSPEVYVAELNSTWQANNALMNAANSCPTFEGNPGFIQEGQCYWAKVGGRQVNWDQTARNSGGDDQAFTVSGGVQVALRDEWRLGFAGAYENSTLSTGAGAETESDRFQGTVLLKNRWDTVSVSAAAFAGYGWSDTTRRMFGLVGDAESDHGAWLAGTNLRVSQLFEQAGGWYLKPMVDLNAMRIGTESFREHGAGGANLAVEGNETWVLTASPAIEIGAEITVEGIVYRPYFRAGGTFFSDATFDMTASFIAAPGHSFKTSTEFDDSYVDIAAGVDILTADGVDLKLTYDGRFSENSDLHAGGVKAAIPF